MSCSIIDSVWLSGVFCLSCLIVAFFSRKQQYNICTKHEYDNFCVSMNTFTCSSYSTQQHCRRSRVPVEVMPGNYDNIRHNVNVCTKLQHFVHVTCPVARLYQRLVTFSYIIITAATSVVSASTETNNTLDFIEKIIKC